MVGVARRRLRGKSSWSPCGGLPRCARWSPSRL